MAGAIVFWILLIGGLLTQAAIFSVLAILSYKLIFRKPIARRSWRVVFLSVLVTSIFTGMAILYKTRYGTAYPRLYPAVYFLSLFFSGIIVSHLWQRHDLTVTDKK